MHNSITDSANQAIAECARRRPSIFISSVRFLGVVIFTSSLCRIEHANQAARSRARPNRLRAEQGVYATNFFGSSASVRISSPSRFVTGTLPSGRENNHVFQSVQSASNFGRCVVPIMQSRRPQKRRADFQIAVLARVQIEHEMISTRPASRSTR